MIYPWEMRKQVPQIKVADNIYRHLHPTIFPAGKQARRRWTHWKIT
nr:MAG TPA: hypothetical protein [Caudoviricetes sp.]